MIKSGHTSGHALGHASWCGNNVASYALASFFFWWPKKPSHQTWVYWQEDKECYFHTYVALRPIIRIQPNLLQRCSQTRWIYIPNLGKSCSQSWDTSEQIFSLSFHSLCIFDRDLRMHTLIKLKFSAHEGLIKSHLCTNFGWNPMKIYGVMVDFTEKKVEDLSCLQGRLLEGIGWNLACKWSNHHRNAFFVFEKVPEKTSEIWRKNQPVSKLLDRNCE